MNVPYHKSEKMFRRYEQHIASVLQHWPEPVSFDAKPLSVTTFSCRFRDAITSVLEYNWPTSLDLERLRALRDEFEVCVVAGMVMVRKKGLGKAMATVGKLDEVLTHDDFIFTLNNPEPAVLFAAAILVDRKVITRPIKIKNTPRSLLDQVTERFDVGISDDVHGYYVML